MENDRDNDKNIDLDNYQKYKKLKTLCYRKKAMHDLEFASLIIDIVFAFICGNLSLMHYLKAGKDFEKKTGIIGFIAGIIGLVITTVYVCYNGYIFNNDIAFSEFNIQNNNYDYSYISKLYSNGAQYKFDTNKYITVYENDKEDFSQ